LNRHRGYPHPAFWLPIFATPCVLFALRQLAFN
jgi:hypothetical protein